MKKVAPQDIQIRREIYPRTFEPKDNQVNHLRACIDENGNAAFPNIVTANGGKDLVDGAHRQLAHILEGTEKITVEDLGKMTDEAILREAIKRNATHGKQLSLKEKEKAARGMFDTSKVSDLATLFAVSGRTVSRWIQEDKDLRKVAIIKKAQKRAEKGEAVNAIAKDLGVARQTLKGWLDAADGEEPTPKPKKSPKPSASTEPSDTSPSSSPANATSLSDDVLDACDQVAVDAYKTAKEIAKEHKVKVDDVIYQISLYMVDKS